MIHYQSPSGERVFGYGHAALLGTSLGDLIHPNDVPKVQAFLADVERGSEMTPRVEWRVHHADGTWIYTETVGNNLLDDPDVCGLVLNSRDIGDRRALQDQLTYQAFHDPLTSLPEPGAVHGSAGARAGPGGSAGARRRDAVPGPGQLQDRQR